MKIRKQKFKHYCSKPKAENFSLHSKDIVTKLLASILCLAFMMLPLHAMALTKAELLRQQQYYAAQAAAAKAAAAKKAQEAAQVKQQITRIDGQITQVVQDIASTSGQMTSTESSIAELEANIKIQEENLAKQKDRMNQVVTSWYMEGDAGGLFEAVLGSNSISEVTTKEQYYESIRQEISGVMDKINKMKEDLKIQKESQSKQLELLNNLKDGQQSQQTDLQDQQTMKNRLLTNTTQAIADLKDQEAEALKKEKAAQGEIQKMEQSAARGSTWTREGTSAQGFAWPVSGQQGCGFGYSSCYFAGVFHTGIDIRAAVGTPVYASKAGTIVYIQSGMGNTYSYNKSYGNYVKIRHEGGVFTMCAHLSGIIVGNGDSVSKGQLIGYSGNSGYSTGPHLHFEMRGPDDVAVDPAPSLP